MLEIFKKPKEPSISLNEGAKARHIKPKVKYIIYFMINKIISIF